MCSVVLKCDNDDIPMILLDLNSEDNKLFICPACGLVKRVLTDCLDDSDLKSLLLNYEEELKNTCIFKEVFNVWFEGVDFSQKAVCKNCGKHVSVLHNKQEVIVRYCMDDNGSYEEFSDEVPTGFNVWVCPECEVELFDNEADALEFLKNHNIKNNVECDV